MKSFFDKTAGIAAILFLGTFSFLSAQVELFPSGYLTASGYVYPNAETVLEASGLRGAFNLDGTLSGAADFRLSLEAYTNLAGIADDTSYEGEWYYPAAYEGDWNERTLFTADLKEAWIAFPAGDFDIAAGKQLITWGQADGTNPTDNVNPRYIGTRSVSASSEKKLGMPMLNLVYNLPSNLGTVQGLFMPLSVPNKMPSMGDYMKVEKPGFAPENMEGGVRALVYPGAVSVSASYLTILDRYPSDAVETGLMPILPVMGPPKFTTVPSVLGHNRQHIIGLDAVYLVGGFDFRTEWAYTLTKDMDGTDPYEKNPFVSGVVQGSRSIFNGTTTVSLSWAPQYIVNFEKPDISGANAMLANLYAGQGFELENMAGLRVQTKLLNETLQCEAMFLTALSARDYLGTAGVTYNIADGWNVKGGVNLFGSFRPSSDSDRQFGTFGSDTAEDSDSLYLELRRDF